MKTILIYGGAFNPPHLGHERILKSAIDFLSPDLTLVVPSAVSPHKANARVSMQLRAQMCECFKKLSDTVRVSLIERAGAHDKSYTLKTLRRVRKKYPDAQLYLLIGSDMLLSFETWHRFRRIFPLSALLAATRTGDDLPALQAQKRRLERMGARVLLLDYEPFPASSSEVRKVLESGGDVSGLLSGEVAQLIEKHSLYR